MAASEQGGSKDLRLEDEAVEQRANDVVQAGIRRGAVSSLVVASIILLSAEAARSTWWGRGWVALLAAVYAARVMLSAPYAALSAEARRAGRRTWRRRFIFGSTIAGVTWAVGLAAIWHVANWHDRVIVVMGVSGMLPSVASSLAAIPAALVGFSVPVWAATALNLALIAQTPTDVAAAGATVLLLPLLLRAGRTLHDEFDRNTRLRLRQQELLVQLERARDAALASAGARREFLAVMSHELRTPLNGVVGMTSLLLDASPSGEQAVLAQGAKDSAQMLLQLIDGVLDFSKIDAGAVELEPAPFCPRRELTALEGLFGLRAKEKQLSLKVRVDDGVPTWVRGDWFRLRQVLVNLLSNALKFTVKGGVTLVVAAGASPGRLRFAVMDTGIGLTPAERARIFTPFVQADSSTTRRYGGTGLGLTISARLVALMGGELTVTSEPGAGSTFSFEVDLPEAAPPASEGLPAEREQLPSGCTVLVCDDNEINLTVARRVLERAGARVEVRRDGAQALEALSASRFDVVLMDLQMPVMDGVEALLRLRLEERASGRTRVPVLALTASASVEERERCLRAGFDGFLAKPVEPAELNRAIARALRPPAGPPPPTT